MGSGGFAASNLGWAVEMGPGAQAEHIGVVGDGSGPGFQGEHIGVGGCKWARIPGTDASGPGRPKRAYWKWPARAGRAHVLLLLAGFSKKGVRPLLF